MIRFLQDHFFGAVMVLALVGVLFGIIATYLISFVLAIFKMAEIGFTFGGVSG